MTPVQTPAQTPLRALIVSASFGSGHHQANGALEAALRVRGVPLDARHADLLKYMSTPERLVTAGTYDLWLRHAPGIYRAFYHLTDTDRAPTAQTFGWLGYPAMRRDVLEVQPEAVVSSYPTPAALADNVRRRAHLNFLNALVITDYRVHQHWARAEADVLMVPSEEAREQMDRWRIPHSRIEVTGIPIAQVYRDLIGAPKGPLRLKHGLDPELPLILISGGGTGSYRALGRVLTELGNLGRPVQVLVLAGADGHGVAQVGGATLHRLGFTTNFPELLAASDLVVGKAGGLTVAESTTLGVPLVVHAPIPGQEEFNTNYLARHGAALWAHDLRDLRPAVLRALDPDERSRMSHAARQVSTPDAADRVAQVLLRRLGRA
ncbi:UDP-N-acetylglucosamine--LPS N-acetylglucosamine transferase [Deinococcus taeanensis]|uniref:MGDG synthase family glycosyltransferase n=1 Tax=Deinococcus taeanensis TaxID=2737050 RepID=UPI001CDCCF68|nr:glycosyltransferase [Deinococcus taeanensis]UBV43726.1 UDP-N-acetylglucosamine--LPS N-acetylglucosamine transferase [Deinococcus taeanensis]